MPAIVNWKDFLVVGVMAFGFILLFNAGLRKAGLSSFTTSGA